MPERLEQRTAASAEEVNVAREWIAPEPLLHLQRQPTHATAHIGLTRRQPYPCPGRHRNHPRSTEITWRSAAAPT